MHVFVSVHGVDGSRSSSYWPLTLHNVHSVEPAAAYVSAGQAVHAVVLSLSSSACPTEHSLHTGTAALSGINHSVPTGHRVHGVLALESSSICPCVQAMHDVVPISEYAPMLHSAHPVVLSRSRSARPAGQLTHVLVSFRVAATHVCPARHSVQGVAGLESLSI